MCYTLFHLKIPILKIIINSFNCILPLLLILLTFSLFLVVGLEEHPFPLTSLMNSSRFRIHVHFNDVNIKGAFELKLITSLFREKVYMLTV